MNRFIPESVLVARSKAGDEAAFTELIERNASKVRRAIRSIIVCSADAEDIMQDTLFKAFKSLHGFNEQCKFSTWLIRIAINNALLLLRRRKRLTEVSIDLETEESDTRTIQLADLRIDPEQTLIREQTVAIVRKAVGVLPVHLRQYTSRRWFDELPHEQVSSSLGITLAAGKSRSLRARRRLEVSLQTRLGNRPDERVLRKVSKGPSQLAV